MFLCVNANAAIDKTVVVNGFALDRIHRPESVVLLPGGKGINVARSLRTLGESAQVTGFAGGFAGRFIADGLVKEGIPAEFAWCDFESRTCLSILDPQNDTLTELYENGEAIPPAQAQALKELFAKLVGETEYAAISGSLPRGLPHAYYAELLQIARAANVPAALDCSGEALRQGLAQGQPALIKPNQAEFQALIGRSLSEPGEFSAAAREVAAQYGTTVILSLGAAGAIAATATESWQACPPPVKIASAVGSGDALLAGVLQSLARGLELPEALRRGVAAGTANALTVGAGRFTREDFESILIKVKIIV
jgi:tagatose 6-phosphate kinase